VSYCNYWGLLWHTCVKVPKAIKLPFGVVSGVGQGMGVLDMGPRLARGRGVLGFFLPHRFEWHF